MKVLSRWHFYPASYVGDGVEAGCKHPSSGHSRRKLTGLLTNLEDLDGFKGGGSADPVEGGLQERMKASRSWARWSGGLVKAIGLALNLRFGGRAHLSLAKMDGC